MRNPKIIKYPPAHYPDMKVIMRKDFYDEFQNLLKKIAKDEENMFFGHNIIKNYMEINHKVSTFCNYEDWHEVYWEKYYYADPLEKTIHKVVQKNDFGVISWELGHNGSQCSQERTKLTEVRDGVCFSFKRPENYIESLFIGWKGLNPGELDVDYISHLSSLLKPLRDYHWDVHSNV